MNPACPLRDCQNRLICLAQVRLAACSSYRPGKAIPTKGEGVQGRGLHPYDRQGTLFGGQA